MGSQDIWAGCNSLKDASFLKLFSNTALDNQKSRDWASLSPEPCVCLPAVDADNSVLISLEESFAAFQPLTQAPEMYHVAPAASIEPKEEVRHTKLETEVQPSFVEVLEPTSARKPAEVTRITPLSPHTPLNVRREDIELDFSGGSPPRAVYYNHGFKDWVLAEKNRTLVWIIGIFLFSAFVLIIILPSYFVHTHPRKREYFIAIEELEWDYAPHKADLCRAPPYRLDVTPWTTTSITNIGSIYRKARFVGYTDATYRYKTPAQVGCSIFNCINLFLFFSHTWGSSVR